MCLIIRSPHLIHGEADRHEEAIRRLSAMSVVLYKRDNHVTLAVVSRGDHSTDGVRVKHVQRYPRVPHVELHVDAANTGFAFCKLRNIALSALG